MIHFGHIKKIIEFFNVKVKGFRRRDAFIPAPSQYLLNSDSYRFPLTYKSN